MEIDKNKIYERDMPMGLDIALAQNQRAQNYFYALAEEGQRQIIEQTRGIGSKEEMQVYVDSLVSNSMMPTLRGIH